MFRTLARVTAILVVAGAVAGMLYVAFGRGPSSPGGRRLTGAEPGSFDDRLTGAGPGSFDGRLGHGPGRRGRGALEGGQRPGREEASVGHGIAGVTGTALQVGCVAAVVVALQRRSRRKQRRPGGQGPASTSPR